MEGMYIGDGPVGFQPEMYNATIATMALGACNTPDRIINCPGSPANGLTHFELMQEMVDFYHWAQNKGPTPTVNTDEWFGGWGNRPWLAPFCNDNGTEWGNTYSDNASSGYVVFALQFAEEMGCVIPAELKVDLSVWIDFIQNDVVGGSGYFNPNGWLNLLRTGHLLAEMAFVGDDINTPRVQNALNYIKTYWDDPVVSADAPGWQYWPMAMYSLMRGFQSFNIRALTISGVERNWYDEFATLLLGDLPSGYSWQAIPEGCWYDGWWGDAITNTCWALLILEGALPDYIMVDFDIHPTSWPNPLNVDLNGVTPVAILGTADFDVTSIDPSSVLLEGVPPLRWAYEDVTTPVSDGTCNATTLGADGFMDLTLKYKTQELVAALGDVNDGDEMVLTVTGLLTDGLAFEGDDCVRIIEKKTEKSAHLLRNSEDIFQLGQNYPNPFARQTTISFYLPVQSDVQVKVYNLFGQELKIVLNKKLPAGKHNLLFDASGLCPGQYIYELKTSENSAIKRMVIAE